MADKDYEADFARPLRWYHLPLVVIGIGINKLADLRCKIFGHKPIYNGELCDRCNSHLPVYDEPNLLIGPPGRYKGQKKD